MLSPQELGIKFENKVHETLEDSLRIKQILREKDVKSSYGSNNSSIDHLLEDYGNGYIICIQDKWENRAACISKINHFLMVVNNISKKHPNQLCIAIYLSKLPISGPSSLAFMNNSIKCINIHDNNMDIAIEKLLECIHIYGMYTYEYDNSLVMR
jgi:hypothetical protein